MSTKVYIDWKDDDVFWNNEVRDWEDVYYIIKLTIKLVRLLVHHSTLLLQAHFRHLLLLHLLNVLIG